jgi:hypothetical protein
MARKIVQKEFAFASSSASSLANPPRLQDLGRLSADVLPVSSRAKKWLKAHRLKTLNEVVEASVRKQVSHQCLDQQVRKELQRELSRFWIGSKFRYVFALNFLDRGVDDVLAHPRVCSTPLERLSLSAPLRKAIGEKGVDTVGELFLQEELKWRHPRVFGNILVDEILAALGEFLSRRKT